jgi:hypothetical protein
MSLVITGPSGQMWNITTARPGGYNQAETDFVMLTGGVKPDTQGTTEYVELPNGIKINFRPKSSYTPTNNGPTLEIELPNGTSIKFRYTP